MVHVLKISKLRQNRDISKSGPLPGRGSLSDTVQSPFCLSKSKTLLSVSINPFSKRIIETVVGPLTWYKSVLLLGSKGRIGTRQTKS